MLFRVGSNTLRVMNRDTDIYIASAPWPATEHGDPQPTVSASDWSPVALCCLYRRQECPLLGRRTPAKRLVSHAVETTGTIRGHTHRI